MITEKGLARIMAEHNLLYDLLLQQIHCTKKFTMGLATLLFWKEQWKNILKMH